MEKRDFPVDHSKKNIAKAIGMTKSELDDLGVKMTKLTRKYVKQQLQPSEVLEAMGQEFSIQELVLNSYLFFQQKLREHFGTECTCHGCIADAENNHDVDDDAIDGLDIMGQIDDKE